MRFSRFHFGHIEVTSISAIKKTKMVRKRTSLTLVQRGLLATFVPLILQVALICSLGGLVRQTEASTEELLASSRFLDTGHKLLDCMSSTLAAAQEYATTGHNEAQQSFTEASSKLKQLSNELRERHRGRAPSIVALDRGIDAALQVCAKLDQAVQSSGATPQTTTRQLDKCCASKSMRDAQTILQGILAKEEEYIARQQSDHVKLQAEFNACLVTGVTLNVLIAVVMSAVFTLGLSRRVASLKDRVSTISASGTTQLATGSDEFDGLDAAIGLLNKVQTKLVKSESRGKTLLDTLPIGLVLVNREGIVEAKNDSFRSVFALTKRKLVGKSIERLLPGLKMEDLGFDELTSGEPGATRTIECTILNGRQMPLCIEVSCTYLKMDEGKRLLLGLNDISKRREVERLKQEFVAMVTHDLKTPLTSIQLFHQILKNNVFAEFPDSASEQLDAAERSVARLLDLVNGLLDVERMAAGELQLDRTETTLAAIVEQSIEAVESFAKQYGITLQSPSFNAPLIADEGRLVQVVVNLLSNAIKFSPEGATVILKSAMTEDGLVELTVSDTGRGIPAEQQEIIFERYKQIEPSNTKENRGTGLGLPICKGIIELHGGSIGVVSEPGRGSTFWLRLPTDSRPEAPAAETSRATIMS